MPQRLNCTPVELHGWDSGASSWHGPDPVRYSLAGCHTLLSRLREHEGSWCGRLRGQVPGGPPLTFRASTRDLDDAGLATLDMDGSSGGPLQTILIVPSQRRSRMRADLAFEFVSFLRFLEGPESSGAESAWHDYMERTLAQSDPASALVFAVEGRSAIEDTRIALCEQADRLVGCMVAWMAERDAARFDTALVA